MAKLRCLCGETIADQTDYIPYKARMIADQDFFDVLDEVEGGNDFALHDLSRDLYQCPSCHRLALQGRDGRFVFFAPDDAERSAGLLRSVRGDKWKCNLRARWSNGSGELWWSSGLASGEGYVRNVATFDELSARYFEEFHRLESSDSLRDAFLSQDGETIHKWPGPSA